MPLRLSLASLRNVIAVVFLQYIISSWRVGAITDTRQGSFCFNLLIPKSGFFFICCGVHKSKFDWQGVCIFFFFLSPFSLSLSLSCKLLLSFTSNCLRSLSDEWIHSGTLSCGLVHHKTRGMAGYNSNKRTSAPGSCKAASPRVQIGQMYVNGLCHCTFFFCACVSHSFPPSLHFFLYSHFLIKLNISPLDVTWTDSCAGGRGENQPQDMSKSEISSPKIR